MPVDDKFLVFVQTPRSQVLYCHPRSHVVVVSYSRYVLTLQTIRPLEVDTIVQRGTDRLWHPSLLLFYCSPCLLVFSSSHHFIFIVKHCLAWKTIFLVHLLLMRNPIVLSEDFFCMVYRMPVNTHSRG